MGELDHLRLLSGYENRSSGGNVFKKGRTRLSQVRKRHSVTTKEADVTVTKSHAKISSYNKAARRETIGLNNRSLVPCNKRGQVKAAVFKSVFSGARTAFSSAMMGLRTLLNAEAAS